MSQLLALRKTTNLSELAILLDIKPAMLSYQLYKISIEYRYTKFEIPKKNGGIREIYAPSGNLKLIQYRLSQLLQNCAEEIRAFHGHSESKEHYGIAHGFKRNHSILTNAQMHKTRRFVFNADLQDFFGSINFGRVRGFFIKDKNFSLHPNVATVIAQIACHENKLPQGSPCSPTISNLIGHVLDILLVRLATETGCTYTRYADDLTFSTNKLVFPASISRKIAGNGHDWTVGSELNRLVLKSGFRFNEAKTRMQYRDSQQVVTGLTVNRKINSSKEYRCKTRAMVHSLINKGTFEHITKNKDANGAELIFKTPGNREELRGMLAFIDQVDQYNVEMYKGQQPVPHFSSSREGLYRQFIFFDSFYATKLPIIVCEGKTDDVYLSHAIHKLSTTYPKLVREESLGKFKLNIRFHKYSNKTNIRMTNLTGGAGPLKNFIIEYHTQAKEFHAPLANQPLIILIDNDAGKAEIIKAVQNIYKKKVTGNEPFVHIFRNLYIILTPLQPQSNNSCIEDFFDADTLKIPHEGKVFNRNDDRDNASEFSKVVFAHKVIRLKAATINFDGFKPLLDRLQLAIEDYALQVKASSELL